MENRKLQLIKSALDEIRNARTIQELHLKSYNAVAKYGMQLLAREYGLFDGEEWSDYKYKAFLLERIEGFFIEKIK